ncbi:MAG TPA: four helix bundle protein [Pyrinomonadaceae bacterium]|jgi:four helix bundle protein
MIEGGLQDLRARTKAFALRIIKLYAALPKSLDAQILGKQLIRSGTSVGAHYHEGCRAKSDADFINKIEGALQELEETIYWLELVSEAGFFTEERLKPLHDEAEELIAMFVTMVKNVKAKGRANR